MFPTAFGHMPPSFLLSMHGDGFVVPLNSLSRKYTSFCIITGSHIVLFLKRVMSFYPESGHI